jgi:hypothetical protein
LQDRSSGGGLTAATFAYQPQCLSLTYIERHIVDSLDGANLPLNNDTLRDGKVFGEVFDPD